MPPVLFFFLLLSEFKPASGLFFLHMSASVLALLFVFFLLQFKSLLRSCSRSGAFHASPSLALRSFRILRCFLYSRRHCRTEFQRIIVFLNFSVYILSFWFSSEGHFGSGKFSAFLALKNSYPERILKIHCQSARYIAHGNPSISVDSAKNGQPGRGRLLTPHAA